MKETKNSKYYDLEKRTLRFANKINKYANKLQRTISNIEDGKKLVRAAGSVGANYIEANEALSKKDFKMRIKISKKEAKGSCYWLRLTESLKQDQKEKEDLARETSELMRIFGSILKKSK